MIVLFLLTYLGGVLTILSPCILPVLPFVFARSDRPFWQSSLPLLGGMALTFAGVASLASAGGAWAVQANQYGRDAALVLMALFAVSLLFNQIAERISRPFVRLGSRISRGSSSRGSALESFIVGIATGLLWAPCAGPILGLVLTGAALGGTKGPTALLLLTYALGAATSLSIALFAGKTVFDKLKRSLGLEEVIRKVLGVAVLVGVAIIALGWDQKILTKISLGGTSSIEQGLIDRFHPRKMPTTRVAMVGQLDDEGPLPAVPAASTWINSKPLTRASLRGHVVLYDFWTYSCINCLRTLPYVRAWYSTYQKDGLIIIGVHTPEFAFEKVRDNVVNAVHELKISYPVALDNDYTVWNAFNNEYWPAHYLVDGKGRVRYHHFGEGSYDETEAAIRKLLVENGATVGAATAGTLDAVGIEKAADDNDVLTPETYLGLHHRANFVTAAKTLKLNEWTLTPQWTQKSEQITAMAPGAAIRLRFHARDVHIVLGPGKDAKPVHYRVMIDGHAPGQNAGVDIAPDGSGVVRSQRLYQIVRQRSVIRDHTVTVEFENPGASAYSFTFG